jgi:hypothetical protein
MAADTGGWVAQPAASRTLVAADACMNVRLVNLMAPPFQRFVNRQTVELCRADALAD